ncbi:hypothetical protein YC2023_119756 [Brassica napus]
MEKRRWPTAQQMDPTDPFRIQMTDMLLEKLHRLSTVLVHLKVLQYNDKLDDYDLIA